MDSHLRQLDPQDAHLLPCVGCFPGMLTFCADAPALRLTLLLCSWPHDPALVLKTLRLIFAG